MIQLIWGMRKMITKITDLELKDILHYCPETGVFTWLIAKSQRVRVGEKGGHLASNGYVVIAINNKAYKAHRLAWLYMTGSWPEEEIDHINGIKNDNRIVNLREATKSQNQHNVGVRGDNSSGYKGVSFETKNKKWRADIQFNGKRIFLGYFDFPKKASEVYEAKAVELFREFKR